MVRHGMLVVAVAVLSFTTTGCLAVYSTRPVEVVVTREDTGEPVAGLPVSVIYGYMLVPNHPKDVRGTTDASGRVVLPIADFDNGTINLQAGGYRSSVTVAKVRTGGTVTTVEAFPQSTGAPKVTLQLVPDKRSLFERLRRDPPRFKPTTVTVAELESKIDRALPIGSTRQEIETWLVSQGMGFSYRENLAIGSDLRQVPDIDKYHGAIVSIVHDTDHSLIVIVSESIQVYFLLDGEGRLANRVVERVLTGP